MPYTDVIMRWWRRGKLSNRTVCDSGVTGAPAAPCTMRQITSVSSDSAAPHRYVATENSAIEPTIRLRRPNVATSHPVIGVATAVASMLNVIAHALSSWVAAIAPCICGSSVEAISRVVEYSVDPTTIETMIMIRRGSDTGSFG